MSRLEEIKARLAAATPGPWGWYGNTDVHNVYLATQKWGRHIVMQFERWGMQSAMPMFFARDLETVKALKNGDLFAGMSTAVTPKNGSVYEVCRSAETRDDDRVYRADIVGFRAPDADLIAHSRADLDYLVGAVDRVLELHADDGNGFCRQCVSIDPGAIDVYYPCATVKAVTGNEGP